MKDEGLRGRFPTMEYSTHRIALLRRPLFHPSISALALLWLSGGHAFSEDRPRLQILNGSPQTIDVFWMKYTKPATRLHGHMAGYDPEKSPTFAWPERLTAVKAAIRAHAEARNQPAGEKRDERKNPPA